MAAFSYQHSTSLLDSVLLPNINKMSSTSLEDGDINTCFSSYPPPQVLLHDVVKHQENRCLYNNNNNNNSYNTLIKNISSEPLVIKKSKTDSSSMVIELDSDDQKDTSVEKKRKNKDGSCLSSAQSQDMSGVKTKKQKKCNNTKKDDQTGEKKSKTVKKDQKKILEEPPTGYIHVRARRGQATDSHSLAERVRREKISERMKQLQGLVPGCDKVTGKALMLDEIINYVQSLQYQVEFLSMKLASVNPVQHDFGADLSSFMIKSEKGSLGSAFASMHQSNLTQPMTYSDTTTTLTTKSNYFHQDNVVFFQQQQGQMLTAFSQPQDNADLLWDVYDQRQRALNQYGFNNLCSFQ
ncbi:hypothetical protein AQUCO_08000003v1 [Aquilegia coerulea]|uniref:BHLH domain-containing protein n=1 Tax=Aquilegia coerulea TaxID=218851 RepID=A0A2G5C7U2_AQUCA|nr:hypothetical protein AQUCO_08000003v1 [Aquilegia coerulea]